MKNVRREDWETLKPTVYGWGILDVNYRVRITEELAKVNGKRQRKTTWLCPYYSDWRDIIRRCTDTKFHARYPSYIGCVISEEWGYLSNFIKWVDSQPNRNWKNCIPDKDLLSDGQKYYAPETVLYVTTEVNAFILDNKRIRGQFMLGVSPTNKNKVNPFMAQCKGNIKKVNCYIGTYKTELEAHKAWQAKKHEYACILADKQTDPRVAKALRERYAPDKDWTKA